MTWRTHPRRMPRRRAPWPPRGRSDVEFAAKLDQCSSAVSSSHYFKTSGASLRPLGSGWNIEITWRFGSLFGDVDAIVTFGGRLAGLFVCPRDLAFCVDMTGRRQYDESDDAFPPTYSDKFLRSRCPYRLQSEYSRT